MPPQRSPRHAATLIATAAAILLALAAFLSGPGNIDEKEQPGTTAFMADVAANDAWLVQRLPNSDIATKPPLLHWAGAISIRLLPPGELALKLPSLAAFLLLTLVTYAIARTALDPPDAAVAAALFASVNPALKLADTARPDMPVALFLTLALLASLLQARHWTRAQPSPLKWIAAFWAAVALALLTKGQVALIAIIWLPLLVLTLRLRGTPIRLARPHLQALGLILAVASFAAWFVAAWQSTPDFAAMLDKELVQRTAWSGHHTASHSPQPWNVPLYVLTYFAPWSALLVLTLAMLVAARLAKNSPPADAPPPVAWALGYLALVVAALMTQPTHRPDHLLPAYPAAAVLAAAAVAHARRARGPHKPIAAAVLILIGLAGLAALAVPFVAPPPTPLLIEQAADLARDIVAAHDPSPSPAALWILASLAALAGATTLTLLVRNRWTHAALAASLAIATLFAINRRTLSSDAQRIGDAQTLTAQLALHASENLDLPLTFYETRYTAIQPLTAHNTPEGPRALEHAATSPRGALVVTPAQHAGDVIAAAPGRAQTLLLVRPNPNPDHPQRNAFALITIEPPAN